MQLNQRYFLQLITIILIPSIFLLEFIIMLALDQFPQLNPFVAGVIDSLCLSIFLIPIIYLTILKPILTVVHQRDTNHLENNSLKETLVQTEKLTAIGKIAAGVAHEINNPLAILLGNIELCEDNLSKTIFLIEKRIILNY